MTNGQTKPNSLEKNLSQFHLVLHKSHVDSPRLNKGLCNLMLAANRLCYGTAKHQVSICVSFTHFWYFQLSHKISDPQTGFGCNVNV
jgi:hypothetical protein